MRQFYIAEANNVEEEIYLHGPFGTKEEAGGTLRRLYDDLCQSFVENNVPADDIEGECGSDGWNYSVTDKRSGDRYWGCITETREIEEAAR